MPRPRVVETLAAIEDATPIEGSYPRAWQVGRHRVHGGRDLDVASLWCTCEAPRSQTCAHRAAILLVRAWQTPTLRPLFTRPAWEIALLPFEAETDQSRPEPSHDGFVRYTLLPPELAPHLEVQREVIRMGRRSGKTLKPRKAPQKLADLEGLVRGLTEADRDFHLAEEHLTQLEKSQPWGTPSQARLRVLRRARIALLEALCRLPAGRLRHEGDPISASTRPLRPRIVGREDDQALQLVWKPAIRCVWHGDPGFGLTEEGTLHAFDADFEAGLLTLPLPRVPAEDVPRFVDRFVLSGRLPFETAGLDANREARLILSEQGDDLLIDVGFAYAVEDAVAVAHPNDPERFLRVHRGVGLPVVERDTVWEADHLERLKTTLRASAFPLRMHPDEALPFLADTLPRLAHNWTVYGRDGLIRNRLRGTVTPSVSVPSDTDFFDLDIDWRVGKQQVAGARILRTWVDGKRFLRLDDGTVASLPTEWLARHGGTLAELEELRKLRDGQGLGAFAAPLARELLAEADEVPEEWAELVDALTDFAGIPDRTPPASVQATLRHYQSAGFRWMAFLRDHGLSGCLADDMGLGKTVQALTILQDTHEQTDGTSLVVCPTSVLFNWTREAARFTPDLKVHVHYGPDRGEIPDDADLVLTTYALLRLDREALEERAWLYVVLDEAQHIKNPTSQVARAARAMTSAHRLALTGTPLENNLHELWSIFQFLMPGFFGSHSAFSRRYANPVHRHQQTDVLTHLRTRVRPFLLRRLKKEVAAELPSRQEVVRYCELGPAHRALYQRVRDTYRASVFSATEHNIARGTLHVLEALTRLRQACCHPSLLPFPEAAHVHGSPKLDLLEELLEEGIAEGHRALVFSQWPSLLDKVADRLDARGWPYCLLTGATRRRAEVVDAFNDPDGPPVFLLSLKAGGTGLNLTAADLVFHLDPWWNPAAEDQATDRAHRIGQVRPVVSYKLVARDTVEELVVELQDRKRALFEAAVDADRVVVDQLTRADLEAVFS